MYGIAPKLPVSADKDYRLQNTETIEENTQQNLKNIILTAPGERVMDPSFGVGLRNYLFENATPFTKGRLESSIESQVAKYMPFVRIEDLFISDEASNTLSIKMRYSIAGIKSDELLFVSVGQI